MHVKFLAHGTGSGARASAYLLGAHDHTGAERAGVTVLRGDPRRWPTHCRSSSGTPAR